MTEFYSASTSLDDTSRTHILRATQDVDGTWIVSDCETTIYGAGASLLEAMVDYWHALRSFVAIVEAAPAAQHLVREAERAGRLLKVRDSE